MRRLVTVCTLVASVSAVQLASQSSGKIPITTRSADARALFLRARALNETLEPHEAHTLFAQALAADPTFAMAEYYLASTAPTAKELTEHLERAIALSSNASPGERLVILGMQARRHADPARARQLAELARRALSARRAGALWARHSVLLPAAIPQGDRRVFAFYRDQS